MTEYTELFRELNHKIAGQIEDRIIQGKAHDGTTVAFYAAPTDIRINDLESFLEKYAAVPRHRKSRVQAFDIDSFAAMTLRDYDAGSMVFVDVSGPGVVFETCLDYHHTINRETEKRDGQRAQRETVVYQPALSQEWEAWVDQAGKPMSQAIFADWIDTHLPDIADPRHLATVGDCTAVKLAEVYGFTRENLWGYADPAKLADVSKGLEIRESCQVKNAVKLESGEVSFTFHTEHTGADGQPLKVPTRFLLSISVFEREAEYFVPVKLTYRKVDGQIKWSFELFRPERFRDDAIKGLVSNLTARLTLPDSQTPIVPIVTAKRV